MTTPAQYRALADALEALRVAHDHDIEVCRHQDRTRVGVCTLCRAAIGQRHERNCDHARSYRKAIDQMIAQIVRQWWEGQG